MPSVPVVTWRDLEYDKAHSPTIRNSHSVISSPNLKDVYLFGGRSKGGANNHLYHLSDLTRGWEEIKSISRPPAPRKSCSLAYCGDKLWLFGGNTTDRILNDLWSFDFKTRSWQQLRPKPNSPIPPVRDRHCMVAHHGAMKLVMFGGSDGTRGKNEFLNDLWEYDIQSNTWREIRLKSPPPRRYEHCMSTIGDSIVIFSGKCRRGGMNDIWMANIKRLDSWKEMSQRCSSDGDIPKRWGSSMTPFENKLVVFGGWDGRSVFDDVIVVDIDALKITRPRSKGSRPAPRVFHGSGVLGKNLVVVAGRDMAKRLQDSHSLDLTQLSSQDKSKDKKQVKKNAVTKPSEFKLMLDRLKRPACLKDLELLDTIGTGSFGRVKLCRSTETGEFFAIKIIKKAKVIKTRQENHIRWEKRILSSIRHPFIVNLEAAFQDKLHLYLTLEFVQGGEFFNLLRKTNVLKVPHARFFAAQIVLVFQFLHKNLIVYRDLKPENCLISSDGYLKLTDFGFAKRLTRKPYKTYTLCGTPEYIAPEILRNQGHGFAVDWWALGILLYEILGGEPPFVDDNTMFIYQKIIKGEIKRWPPDIDPTVKDFISKLLVGNPEKRLGNLAQGSRDIMVHAFFKRVTWRSLLEKRVPAPYLPEAKGPADIRHFDKFSDDSDGEDEERKTFKDPFMGGGW